MAHECPDCLQQCYCDGEDTFISSESLNCAHECDDLDLSDDDGDFDCDICEDNGCASCIADEQCCKAYPDCLHVRPNCGNRQAVSKALVAPLFETEKCDHPPECETYTAGSFLECSACGRMVPA